MTDIRIAVGDALQELTDSANEFSEAFHWDRKLNDMPIPDDSEINSYLLEATYWTRQAQNRLASLVAPYKVATLKWLLAEAEQVNG